MPHSAAGIYSEYYASKYPKEVSAIIMLDTTSTARIENGNAPSFVYKIAKIQQACAVTRINALLVPETKLVENGYTEKEISDYKKFTYHVINDTFINQSSVLMDNVKEVNKIDFPKDIPVIKIISKKTLILMSKKDKDDGMAYQNEHLKRLGNSADYKVLEGSHFIYQTKIDEIAQIAKTFLL
jgi:pimeloyl-ACP methyl ester carboxylesterase